MKQYVLTPLEAKTLAAVPGDGTATVTQLAVDARLLPSQVHQAAAGLAAKGLAVLSGPVRLTPEGRRVREWVGRGAAPGAVLGPATSGAFLNPWTYFGQAVFGVDQVLILPEQEGHDADGARLGPDELDRAIDDELTRRKSAPPDSSVKR